MMNLTRPLVISPTLINRIETAIAIVVNLFLSAHFSESL